MEGWNPDYYVIPQHFQKGYESKKRFPARNKGTHVVMVIM
jgi:hypothetical protein